MRDGLMHHAIRQGCLLGGARLTPCPLHCRELGSEVQHLRNIIHEEKEASQRLPGKLQPEEVAGMSQ